MTTIPASQIANNPYKNINGLKVSRLSNTTLNITSGTCRDSTNVYDMTSTDDIIINAAANGLNGLDTGTFAASKVYAVFLISDPVSGNPTGGLMSLSYTAPLMPVGRNGGGGYGAFRLVGFWASDASVHFLTGYYFGENNERLFMYDAPQATAISAGAATTYTAIDLSAVVPAVENLPVWAYTDFTPGAASRQLFLQPSGATGDAIKITGQVTSVHVTSNSLVMAKLVSGVPKISYKVSNSGDATLVDVAGFQLSL